MLAADVADVVLVAPGVLDDVEDRVDAALDEDELPPQPLSKTKALSATVTAAIRRHANAWSFVASVAFSNSLAAGEE